MSATEWIGSSQVIRSRWLPEQRLRRGRERRVLDPCARQPLDHATVQADLRRHRDAEVAVRALEVDDVDAVQPRQRGDEVVVPAGVGSSLKRRPGFCAQPRMNPGQAWRFTDADRRHEVDRADRPADGVLQREAVLTQREVERRALERPPAVEAGALADRLDREQVGQAEQRRDLVERTGAVQPAQVAAAAQQLDLVDLVPRDVLALADMGSAAETHDERHLREPARRVAHERLQLTPIDDNRQPGEARVDRGGGADRRSRRPRRAGESLLQSSSASARATAQGLYRAESIGPGAKIVKAGERNRARRLGATIELLARVPLGRGLGPALLHALASSYWSAPYVSSAPQKRCRV